MVDVLSVGDVNLCDIDYLSYGIRAALDSCIVPEVKINFNSVSNEYNIEVLENTIQLFTPDKLPHTFTFGIAGKLFFFDMTYEEYMSMDTSFVGVVNSKGELLQLEKLDGAEIPITMISTAYDKARRNAAAIFQILEKLNR